MNVLLVEDTPEKLEEIKLAIAEIAGEDELLFIVADSVNSALRSLGESTFDLVIVDLVLPQISGSKDAQDTTAQWCEHIENSGSTRVSSWIVLTAYSEIADESRRSLSQHGVAVVQYGLDESWKRVIQNKARELYVNRAQDFVIVCALEKEKRGFTHCSELTFRSPFTLGGLDCQAVSIGDLCGTLVVLSRPGLVSAAIETMKALVGFRPRAIAMSGICGGVQGESELGDLVVPDLSWNYQSGKIKEGVFKPELVQVPLPPETRVKLRQLSTDAHSRELRNGLFHSELSQKRVISAPMVSGSQVVSDATIVSAIDSQSRKIAALDMEVAAVFAAAHDFYNGGGMFFAAKSVVDLADVAKDDRYHEYGSALSARFVVNGLRSLLGK